RRVPALRGRVADAGAGGQPRRRGADARHRARHRGPADPVVTGLLGHPRVHHRVTASTNERAKELALAGAPHGTIVTADEQTAGRGRQGRTWVAPPGSALLLSVLLRDLGKAQAHLPLAAALAVCEACEQAAPVSCRIKWPNDV